MMNIQIQRDHALPPLGCDYSRQKNSLKGIEQTELISVFAIIQSVSPEEASSLERFVDVNRV